MKKILLLACLILLSCTQKDKQKKSVENVPEALQEKTLSRYSRSSNLVEELYQELVAKSPELQNLENELNEFQPDEAQDIFYNYNRKSVDYYSAANAMASRITDSLTKTKILEIIRKSNNSYLSKTFELDKLTKIIHSKKNSVDDSHNILKIMVTLPVIGKYQNENIPGKEDFEKTVKKEDSLIREMQHRTPKY